MNLVSDEEKKTDSNNEEEDSQEIGQTLREMAINQRRKEIATEALPLSTSSDAKVEEDPEEETNSEETLSEMAKVARHVYNKRKVATSTPSAEKPSYQPPQNDEEIVETKEASRKRGKGKDIAIMASVLKA